VIRRVRHVVAVYAAAAVLGSGLYVVPGSKLEQRLPPVAIVRTYEP
jgi:hypothetical protein